MFGIVFADRGRASISPLRSTDGVQSFDQAVLRWFADAPHGGLHQPGQGPVPAHWPRRRAHRALGRSSSPSRVVGRFRHLVVFLATFVISDWLVGPRVVRAAPAARGAGAGRSPRTYAFPSRPIASMAVTLGRHGVRPRPARTPPGGGCGVGIHVLIAFEVILGLYLAADYPGPRPLRLAPGRRASHSSRSGG